MKLKALGTLCKRKKYFCLYNQLDQNRINADENIRGQWLGTKGAIYPLEGLPQLTTENIVAMFDITEKQREKIFFKTDIFPIHVNVDDLWEDEILLDRELFEMYYNGLTIRPVITSNGIEFLDSSFFAPLADVEDSISLYERKTSEGKTFFAVKMGFMIVAVFFPLNIIEEKLVDNVETLAKKFRIALERKKEEF